MKQEEFVGALRDLARDAAVEGVLSVVSNPPGRRPAPELLELSGWHRQLSDADRQRLRRMLELVAHQAVFGVLSVLDGTRQVEPTLGPKKHFEIRRVSSSGDSEVLAGPEMAPLHELL